MCQATLLVRRAAVTAWRQTEATSMWRSEEEGELCVLQGPIWMQYFFNLTFNFAFTSLLVYMNRFQTVQSAPASTGGPIAYDRSHILPCQSHTATGPMAREGRGGTESKWKMLPQSPSWKKSMMAKAALVLSTEPIFKHEPTQQDGRWRGGGDDLRKRRRRKLGVYMATFLKSNALVQTNGQSMIASLRGCVYWRHAKF